MGAVKATLALALSTMLCAPASAQWITDSPTADANAVIQIKHAVDQVTQTLALVQTAKQELQQLPQSFTGTNIPGRIAAVSNLLQFAQTTCMQARSNVAAAPQCQVRTGVAIAQSRLLGEAMASTQSLQNAARGSSGGLQAAQTSAHGIIEVATQLQQMHQLSIADATQKTIDDKITTQALKPGVVNPW